MDTLADRVSSRKDGKAFAIGGATPLRWCDLVEQASNLAGHLNSRDLVVIEGVGTVETYVAVTACVLAEAPFLLRHAGYETTQVIEQLVTHLEPTVRITVSGPAISVNRLAQSEWVLGKTLPQLRYVGLTSGSSGPVRAVLLPRTGHDEFLSRGIKCLQLSEDAVFGDPANASDLSLTNYFLSLFAGATWLPLLNISERVRAFQSLFQFRATHWRSVPTWVSMIQRSNGENAVNATMRVFGFGGEVLTYHAVAAARSLFPEAQVLNTYGSTETNGFASAADLTADEVLDGSQVCPIGEELDGWRFSMGKTSPSELVVTSPHLALGYLEPDKDTNTYLAFHQLHGRIRTGDIVELHANSKFVVIGRKDRRFNHRGVLVSPEPLEKRVASILNTDCCLVHTNGEVVLLVEGPNEDTVARERIALAALPPRLPVARILHITRLPRLASSKIDYRAAQRLAQEAHCKDEF